MDPVVVGCEAIDAGPDWVRLRVPGSAVRSIPWSSITAAAAPSDDGHMTFEGDLAPITQFRGTHFPLWIEYGDGVAVAMLEQGSPKSDAIVGVVRERVGARWLEPLTTAQAAQRLFKAMPSVAGLEATQKRILWMILMVIGLVVMAVAALVVHQLHH
jgi:hypothetical protein